VQVCWLCLFTCLFVVVDDVVQATSLLWIASCHVTGTQQPGTGTQQPGRHIRGRACWRLRQADNMQQPGAALWSHYGKEQTAEFER